jgi:hypothetical protein
LDRKKLKEMLEIRVADGSLLRLIGKCLHVGVLDGVELSTSGSGTAQGSVLSPLLGNVYLHYVLDSGGRRRGSRAGKVRRPSTSLASRSIGRETARGVGACCARHAVQA